MTRVTFIAFHNIESVIREHFHINFIYICFYDNAFGMQTFKSVIFHLTDEFLLKKRKKRNLLQNVLVTAVLVASKCVYLNI